MNYFPIYLLVFFISIITFCSYDQYFKKNKEYKQVEKNLKDNYGKITKNKGK